MTDEVARKRTGLYGMMTAAHDEAVRIRQSQDALIKVGLRKEPDPGQIRKMHAFEDIARLLQLIQPHAKEVTKIIIPKKGLVGQGDPDLPDQPVSETTGSDD